MARIRTIGSSSRDHVDINAWIAFLPTTLTQQEIGEMYNDTEFVSSTSQRIGSITTTTAFNLVLRPATGEAFNDTEQELRYNVANGVGIVNTASYTNVMRIANSVDVDISNIQIKSTHSTSSGLYITSNSTDVKISNSIILSRLRGIQGGGSADAYLANSLIYLESNSTSTAEGCFSSYGQINYYNCTFFNNRSSSSGFGYEKGGGSQPPKSVVKNCTFFNFGTAMESGTWGAGTDYNATNSSSLPAGSNNQLNLVDSNEFEDTTLDAVLDLRALASGSLKNGTRDVTNTNDVDIFGNARDLTTPYIGCYEVSGGGAGGFKSHWAVNSNRIVI